MTREEIIRNLKYTMKKHKNDTVTTFETNISAMCKDILDYLQQEPCEDCISRQAVNEGFKKYANSSFAYGCVWDYINKLPSVTPKEKIIHCKDCKYRDYWGDCYKWSKELDAHKSYILDENMFCGFAERKHLKEVDNADSN